LDGQLDGDLEPITHSPAPPRRTKTGGRVKGSRNKQTADLQLLARVYTAQALDTIARVMVMGDTDAAKVMAAKELLDRGYGKAAQAVTLSGNLTVTSVKILEDMRSRARALRLVTDSEDEDAA
jgi:hypothetical protein